MTDKTMKTLTVFCSSLPAAGTPPYEEARRLGRLLAETGLAVSNGGYGGLMEASARGAREAGGHTIGVTCAAWPGRANPWIVEEVRTGSYSERIMTLIGRGDAYLALPGGTGTLAELALAWEMMNKSSLAGKPRGRKPLLLMVPYWQPVIEALAQEAALAASGSSLRPSAMDIITPVESPEQAVDRLRDWRRDRK